MLMMSRHAAIIAVITSPPRRPRVTPRRHAADFLHAALHASYTSPHADIPPAPPRHCRHYDLSPLRHVLITPCYARY